ncbi:glycosyltransferase 87 family protein [Kribbella jejuensis]|uniref:Alpha-1,2-mannosyltransferase n=1 Tax=Kribbella jejuensis TaxID=236068 RepID=A0A542EA09_9ACTN|nr:glycosyltransferase 87 family protein [Kribbella jejuensis]TQJ12161.1 alpha-1,2-mannosyltransferase [Kribbella jejuensis]
MSIAQGNSWSKGLTALVVLLAVALLVLTWGHTGADLKVYRVGGWAILTDPSRLYDVHPAGMSMPFTYPIFAAILMAPVAVLPWPLAYALSIVVSLAAVALIWKVCLPALTTRPPVLALVALFAASLLLEPVRETLSYGQINLVLCAVVLSDALDLKHRGRGIGIGIAAGIKLTPLVFVAFLLVTGQRKAFLRASAAFLATVAAGFVIAPRTAFQYWTVIVNDHTRIGGLAYSGNQSWNGFLVRLSGDLGGGGVLWIGTVVLTAVAGLWLSRALWLAGRRLAAVSVCGLISVLCSPVSWSHHWVWVLPLGISLAACFDGRRRLVAAGLWYLAFVVAPIWWPPRRDNRELHWNLWQQLAGNAYLWLGLGAAAFLWTQLHPKRLALTPQLVNEPSTHLP